MTVLGPLSSNHKGAPDRAKSPVWHRACYNSVERHYNHELKCSGAQRLTGLAAEPGPSAAEGAFDPRSHLLLGYQVQDSVVVGRHYQHTIRTTAVRPYVPGKRSTPPTDLNERCFSDELHDRLSNLTHTLAAVAQRSAAVLAAATDEDAAGPYNTVALRQAVNSALGHQIEYHTAVMSHLVAAHAAAAEQPVPLLLAPATPLGAAGRLP